MCKFKQTIFRNPEKMREWVWRQGGVAIRKEFLEKKILNNG